MKTCFMERTDRPSRDPIAEKLNTFVRLKHGWHYGAGGPISLEVVSAAGRWIERLRLHSFTKLNVFPGVGGEVAIVGRHLEHRLEIVCESNSLFSLTHKVSGEEVDSEDDCDFQQAKSVMQRMVDRIWLSPASFTRSIMIQTEKTSAISLLDHRVMDLELLLLTSSAFEHQVDAYVSIFGTTTLQSLASPRSFLSSARKATFQTIF